MRKLSLAAALAAATFAVPAMAQDATSPDATPQDSGAPAPASTQATAPDGSKAFGIDPYVAVMGGWEGFDDNAGAGLPRQRGLDGALVEGIAGVNVPLGPVFVGAEGSVAKGVSGAIDWEYGAAGRFGFRAGESGLFYGKVGYRWVNFDHLRPGSGGNTQRDYDAMTYGVGAEVGPKDIGLGGLTGQAGVRFRFEVDTYNNADSFRPMAGLVAHF